MDKLKNCPFCGVEAALADYVDHSGEYDRHYVAVWPSCRCCSGKAYRYDPPMCDLITKEMCIQEAVTFWNTRAPIDALDSPEMVEAVAKKIIHYIWNDADGIITTFDAVECAEAALAVIKEKLS